MHLHLAGNSLSRLPADWSRLGNIVMLNIADNRLKVQQQFTSFPSTDSTIDVSLQIIPPQLTEWKQLKLVDLDGNKMSTFSDSIAQLGGVRKVPRRI